MSSTPAYRSPAALTAPATANFIIAAVILGLFALAAIVSAERKDVTQGFDELAHASYVAHIQETGQAWPAFADLHLLDPQTFQFTAEPNYLNHPPIFYALLAAVGPRLIGRPQAIVADRLIDSAIVVLGLAALLWLGLAAHFSRVEFYVYAVPLACVPVLAPLAGSVNNDNLAFLGGALATLGVWQLAARKDANARKRIWLAIALIGLIAAAWAKLTGLVLTAGMVGGTLAYLAWKRQLPTEWAIAALLALAIGAAPYMAYYAQYGSFAPDTPAQIAALKNDARILGWAGQPHKSFPAYLTYFAVAFIVEWMPALGTRNAVNHLMLLIPAAAIVCAMLGIAISSRRIWRGEETALDVVVLAGAASLAATLALHVRFSYGHYLATDWMMEAYPRYYLPLAAIVPLAGLSLLGAVESPRWRNALLAFLIGGPIVFRLLGAPLS